MWHATGCALSEQASTQSSPLKLQQCVAHSCKTFQPNALLHGWKHSTICQRTQHHYMQVQTHSTSPMQCCTPAPMGSLCSTSNLGASLAPSIWPARVGYLQWQHDQSQCARSQHAHQKNPAHTLQHTPPPLTQAAQHKSSQMQHQRSQLQHQKLTAAALKLTDAGAQGTCVHTAWPASYCSAQTRLPWPPGPAGSTTSRTPSHDAAACWAAAVQRAAVAAPAAVL
jgi:hypothetical protein